MGKGSLLSVGATKTQISLCICVQSEQQAFIACLQDNWILWTIST